MSSHIRRRGAATGCLLCLLLAAVGAVGAEIPHPSSSVVPEGDGPWVVRAFFPDREAVERVSGWADVWTVYPQKGYLVAMVDAEELGRLLDAGFYVEVDERRTAALGKVHAPLEGQSSGIPGFPCYRTVEETFDSAAALVASYPQLATWTDIGDSWEKTQDPGQGYDLMLLKLTNSNVPGPKPKLMVTGGIHAREYTTAEMVTRFAEYLLDQHGSDPDVTWLLNHHEIHLVLQANPDGRKQAESGLLWRKNANNNYCTNTNDRGADLNRNFDFEWACCGGSSTNPCSQTYHGASAASEPETQAVAGHMTSIFPDQRPSDLTTPAPLDATGVYLDMHSFGGAVLSVWGFTPTPPPNGDGILTLGRKIGFYNGYAAQLGSFGTVDGSTKDFSYGELGVPGYTIELGTEFFQECAFFETAIYPGNLEALLYAAKVVRTPYVTPSGPDTVDPEVPAMAFEAGDLVPLVAAVDDTRYDGSEPTQNIAAAEYYLGVPPWGGSPSPQSMTASDGSFDEGSEAVEAVVDTTGLTPGRYTIFVRGQDTDGNWGAVSATFLYIIDPVSAPVVEGTVREKGSGTPLAAVVTAGPFQAASDSITGEYSMQIPPGTYEVTASADGYGPVTATVVAPSFQTVQQDFDLPEFVALFSDDVETGNMGWSIQAPWAITTEASFSPTHSWTDSPGGNYANNRNISLTSPVLDLSGFEGVTLSFRHIYDLEAGFDFGYVEVSANGGSDWSSVTAFNGEGQTASWALEEIALPMLDDVAQARIRFRLESDGGVTEDGWHLDDIEVRAFEGNSIFTDGFESGNLSSWSAVVP